MNWPAEFEELRGRTFAIAYRMTGSVADAEEIGQESMLRLEQARQAGEEVSSPNAWVSTVATRLAIDHLRSARAERETYVGPWLPEPLVTDEGPAPVPELGPAEHAEVADSLSQAFLVLLESLSPVERAVFLLREVFGYEYERIASTVGRSEENCRQILARARRKVEERRTRFETDEQHRDELLDHFLEACESGDVEALESLLAADVVVYSDGGGKASAARRPIHRRDLIVRFLIRVTRMRRERGGFEQRRARVNGQPGRLILDPDGTISDVLTIDVADGAIQTIRIVRNPDKLRHLNVH
jgi:RNA polymerase sigma-70 factor (ECF subfamily)